MSEILWTEVDAYLEETLLLDDTSRAEALAESEAAGLPQIQVSPVQGKFLALLVQMTGARRILELGTLGGYSTLWLASALPEGGKLVTMEFEARHAEVASRNFARSAHAAKIELMVGAALESLATLVHRGEPPFDFIFIDADKDNYPGYFEACLKLARPGTVMVVDNVIRNGAVTQPDHPDPRVQGVRRFFELVAAEKRVSATALQTVGGKGYDGLAILRVQE